MTDSLDPEVQAALGTALRVLLRAGREMHTAMAHHLGLGETDLAAMDQLVSSTTPLGPVELGYRLGIRSASSTVLVDRLEAAGHLRREPHPSDRRRVVLRASESARAEVRATLTPLLVAISDITARLDTHPGHGGAVLPSRRHRRHGRVRQVHRRTPGQISSRQPTSPCQMSSTSAIPTRRPRTPPRAGESTGHRCRRAATAEEGRLSGALGVTAPLAAVSACSEASSPSRASAGSASRHRRVVV